MHELSTNLTFITDPAHGWLRVPLVDIATLGVETAISSYSFIDGRFAYRSARQPRREFTEIDLNSSRIPLSIFAATPAATAASDCTSLLGGLTTSQHAAHAEIGLIRDAS